MSLNAKSKAAQGQSFFELSPEIFQSYQQDGLLVVFNCLSSKDTKEQKSAKKSKKEHEKVEEELLVAAYGGYFANSLFVPVSNQAESKDRKNEEEAWRTKRAPTYSRLLPSDSFSITTGSELENSEAYENAKKYYETLQAFSGAKEALTQGLKEEIASFLSRQEERPVTAASLTPEQIAAHEAHAHYTALSLLGLILKYRDSTPNAPIALIYKYPISHLLIAIFKLAAQHLKDDLTKNFTHFQQKIRKLDDDPGHSIISQLNKRKHTVGISLEDETLVLHRQAYPHISALKGKYAKIELSLDFGADLLLPGLQKPSVLSGKFSIRRPRLESGDSDSSRTTDSMGSRVDALSEDSSNASDFESDSGMSTPEEEPLTPTALQDGIAEANLDRPLSRGNTMLLQQLTAPRSGSETTTGDSASELLKPPLPAGLSRAAYAPHQVADTKKLALKSASPKKPALSPRVPVTDAKKVEKAADDATTAIGKDPTIPLSRAADLVIMVQMRKQELLEKAERLNGLNGLHQRHGSSDTSAILADGKELIVAKKPLFPTASAAGALLSQSREASGAPGPAPIHKSDSGGVPARGSNPKNGKAKAAGGLAIAMVNPSRVYASAPNPSAQLAAAGKHKAVITKGDDKEITERDATFAALRASKAQFDSQQIPASEVARVKEKSMTKSFSTNDLIAAKRTSPVFRPATAPADLVDPLRDHHQAPRSGSASAHTSPALTPSAPSPSLG